MGVQVDNECTVSVIWSDVFDPLDPQSTEMSFTVGANATSEPRISSTRKKKDKGQEQANRTPFTLIANLANLPHGLPRKDSPSPFSLTTTKAGSPTLGASIHGVQGRLH
jgi:hypothetical protein